MKFIKIITLILTIILIVISFSSNCYAKYVFETTIKAAELDINRTSQISETNN